MTVAHVVFDTLKYFETLIVAGMPKSQAKALSEAQKEMLENNLASKIDILEINQKISEVKSELKNEIAEVKSDVKLLKWMIGFVLAVVTAIAMNIFFKF